MKPFVIPRNRFLNDHAQSLTLVHALAIADNIYREYGSYTSNRQRMMEFVGNGFYSTVDPHIGCIPDLKKYEDMLDWFKFNLAMKAIEKDLTGFEKAMKDLIHKYYDENPTKSVQYNDFGIIASIPKVYKEAKEREYFDDIMDTIRSSSEYISREKHRDNYKIKLISKRYVRDRGFWVINALYDEKHLVTYFDSKDDIQKIKVGDYFKIRATVKRQQFSQFNQCKETQFTRVVYS